MKNVLGVIGCLVIGYVLFHSGVDLWKVGAWVVALCAAFLLVPRRLQNFVVSCFVFVPIAIYVHRVGEARRSSDGMNILDGIMAMVAGVGLIHWLMPTKSFGRTVLEGAWCIGCWVALAAIHDPGNQLHDATAKLLGFGPAGYIGLGVLALVVLIGAAGTKTGMDAAGEAAENTIKTKLKK